VTALSLALAFTSALAFAGWVLWLLERRKITLLTRLDAYQAQADEIAKVVQNHSEALKLVVSTVESLAIKAGFKAKP
jgi:cystathionine beta-lyase/cystathionine gamma-synthase